MLNVVTGGGSKAGQYMLDHPGFRKLAFTGSTEVGLDVAKAAADKLIPSTLELGGKSANIFFEDCDWDTRPGRPAAGHPVQPGPGVLRRLPGVRPGEHL